MNGKSALILSRQGLGRFFLVPYLLLLVVGLTLPSDGSHGLFTPKSLAFLLAGFSLAAALGSIGCCTKVHLWFSAFFFASLIFLLLWVMVALSMDIELHSLFDQFKLFILTISVGVMTYFCAAFCYLNYGAFLKVLIYANFVYSMVKVSFVFLFLAGVIDLQSFLEASGIRYMEMAITDDLTRLQTSVDIATPFLLFFVLHSDRLGVKLSPLFRLIYLSFCSTAIFLSFSRFLLAVMFYAFLSAFVNAEVKKKAIVVAGGIAMAFGFLFLFGIDETQQIIERRFFSSESRESDAIRSQQINALNQQFLKRPLFGHGMGAYSPDVIRDAVNHHSYEVQWVAFLMQFGLFGLLFILVPLSYIGWQFLRPPLSIFSISCFGLYLLWLCSGFFNPFLISLASGILYTLFFWTGCQIRRFLLKNSYEYSPRTKSPYWPRIH